MGMFDGLKQTLGNLTDNAKMQQQALAIQRELQKELITVEKGDSKVVIRGDQRIMEVIRNGERDRKMEDMLNDGMQKIQKVMMQKMTDLQKQMK